MESDMSAAVGELKGRIGAMEGRQNRMDENYADEMRQLRQDIASFNAAIFKKMDELATAAARRQGSDSALRMIGALVVSFGSAFIGAVGGHYWPTK